VTGRIADGVLIGFVGWMVAMRKKGGSGGYHHKASSICKCTRDVRKAMERKCGQKFGGGHIPAPVQLQALSLVS
jgi:hypothetical protein